MPEPRAHYLLQQRHSRLLLKCVQEKHELHQQHSVLLHYLGPFLVQPFVGLLLQQWFALLPLVLGPTNGSIPDPGQEVGAALRWVATTTHAVPRQ